MRESESRLVASWRRTSVNLFRPGKELKVLTFAAKALNRRTIWLFTVASNLIHSHSKVPDQPVIGRTRGRFGPVRSCPKTVRRYSGLCRAFRSVWSLEDRNMRYLLLVRNGF